jgi:hypothetical protein
MFIKLKLLTKLVSALDLPSLLCLSAGKEKDSVRISKNNIFFGYDGVPEMRVGKRILIASINP